MGNTGISTFYVGYLVGQLPGNMLLARTNPHYFLPAVMYMWSCGTICMPAMTNGAGFAVCRFFIGLTEAPFFPALTLLTSSWYTKEESPLRMAIWHAGNTISNLISGFLAAGILEHMNNTAGLRSWQWFFLIEGMASIVVACAAFILLPEWPSNTRFLTEQEREMARYRILVSNGGHEEEDGGLWDGLKQALQDFLPSVSLLYNHATHKRIHWLAPQIMKTFNFNKTTTYLVQAPPYAIAYTFACLIAYSCGRFQESTFHVIVPILFSAVGCAALIGTLNRAEPAAVVGDDGGARAADQEGGADCRGQLHQPGEPLVQPVLLPDEPGAILPDGWRAVDHGMRVGGGIGAGCSCVYGYQF
ncbi:Major facilitator superfamily domain, general substrate transporter [Beauveria brongniartii RCEF 3172]|uniref:Major facilitator superfamily domain, general substrate transporter n=1 Tax=Beauveria brongniartii RCEF 3172 TaxID=1081107 RepID=A0A169YEN9_9HYPO|nr:Major facilitator superfamily domain, general substrate transporter [Beauveria brongniartii RCEF 3172]